MDLQELTKKFENDRPFLYETLRVQLGTLGIEAMVIYFINTLEAQQVSVEPVVKPEIAKAYNKGKEDAVTEIIKQLEEYIKTGNIDFISVSLGWVEKRLRKALKQFSV